MPESFGARLRRRREEQSIALTTIAERTKIAVSLLEALERNDVSHWPSGIFRRSFMRDYARAIGLDPESSVREFLELYPDPLELAGLDPAVSAGTAPGPAGPPTRFRSAVSSLLRRGRRSDGHRPPLETPGDGDGLPFARAGAPPSIAPSMIESAAAVAVMEPTAGVASASMAEHVETQASIEDAVADIVTDSTPAGVGIIEPLPVPSVMKTDAPACTDESLEAHEPPPFDPDLMAAARLCTELGCAADPREVGPLIRESARILDAIGLIVWIWNAHLAALMPVLAHGYPDRMVAQLPKVAPDADNPTAAAFRTSEIAVVSCGGRATGALVVPMLTPLGCAGVLTIELRDGRELRDAVRAVATILAAQLARLVELEPPAAAVDRRLA